LSPRVTFPYVNFFAGKAKAIKWNPV
jgi:hypothetical protein